MERGSLHSVIMFVLYHRRGCECWVNFEEAITGLPQNGRHKNDTICSSLSGATMITPNNKDLHLAHLCLLQNINEVRPYFEYVTSFIYHFLFCGYVEYVTSFYFIDYALCPYTLVSFDFILSLHYFTCSYGIFYE